MKIALLSDTHSGHFSVPTCDILIHCGDATNLGKESEIHNFNRIVGFLKDIDIIKKCIFIPGNHDLTLDPDNLRSCLFNAKELLNNVDHILINDTIEIDGLKIHGNSYTPTFFDWAFMKSENELWNMFQTIPKDLDLLISHGPPRGILDINERNEPCGSFAMEAILPDIMPKIMAFGHIHHSRGTFNKDWGNGHKTQFVNCSSVDARYNILPAIMIDV
jgi:Icc-related predicted phosphoesterase